MTTNVFFPVAPATVRDVMRTDVVAVVPEMTVRELIHLLLEERISGAPVLAPTGKVLGVVSGTDVLRLASRPSGQLENAAAYGGAFADSGSLSERCVADIMTPVVFTVHPEESLSDLARFFRQGRVHRALVMENGMLLGVVTPFDMVQSIFGAAM
jgi:CBS domain-containing protein